MAQREIKFREFINGKFHYWGFVEEGIFKGPVTPSLTRGIHSQFTGLKDKNRKEIYEHDLIRWPHLSNQLNEVYFSAKEVGFFAKPINKDKTESYLGGKCEIVGNIYENPELLNV